MLLKDIIRYIDFLSDVTIITDTEEVFKGSVLDIPWIYLDMPLSLDGDGEAIYADGKDSFTICLIDKEV